VKRYTVDWSDAAYPTIRAWEAGEYADPLTLAEAKAEIIEHFEHLRDHARSMIATTRALRAADITLTQENPS